MLLLDENGQSSPCSRAAATTPRHRADDIYSIPSQEPVTPAAPTMPCKRLHRWDACGACGGMTIG